jgi:hypothetical protein
MAKKRANDEQEYHERLMIRHAAQRALHQYENEIMKLPGVIGVSIGSRFKKGKPTGEIAIRLHMETAEAKDNLKNNAKACGLRKTYGGFRVDLLPSTSRLTADQHDGTEIKSGGGLGTLGTTVMTGSGVICWLTAGHVIAGGHINSLPTKTSVNDATGLTKLGSVPAGKRWFWKDERVDAALIKPQDDLSTMPTGRTIAEPILEREVTIPSDHAGITIVGIVDSLTHPPIDIQEDSFKAVEHFLIRPKDPTQKFIQKGDSGAAVFDGNKIVGIVRGVLDDNQLAFACRITKVLDRIDFEV